MLLQDLHVPFSIIVISHMCQVPMPWTLTHPHASTDNHFVLITIWILVLFLLSLKDTTPWFFKCCWYMTFALYAVKNSCISESIFTYVKCTLCALYNHVSFCTNFIQSSCLQKKTNTFISWTVNSLPLYCIQLNISQSGLANNIFFY